MTRKELIEGINDNIAALSYKQDNMESFAQAENAELEEVLSNLENANGLLERND